MAVAVSVVFVCSPWTQQKGTVGRWTTTQITGILNAATTERMMCPHACSGLTG